MPGANGHPEPFLDTLGRPLRSLRVSVTDRCNLRCLYCMPEESYVWLPREDLLTFEEMADLVGVFTDAGVNKVRITGGEPLLRRDLPALVRMLAANPLVHDLAMTTNGVLLGAYAKVLRDAGLRRLNISLDTLRPERFRTIARRDSLADVLAGARAAADVGFRNTKLDVVLIRGFNSDEVFDLLDFARATGTEVRFLEYMDVPGATRWAMEQVVSRSEILADIERRYGRPESLAENGAAPAERFMLPDGTVFGIIASTTTPFCRTCDRSRLTADGLWYLCLYGTRGTDLRRLLRGGATRGEIHACIVDTWQRREDRGAEDRLKLGVRKAFVPIESLRSDPHLEMHTRGG